MAPEPAVQLKSVVMLTSSALFEGLGLVALLGGLPPPDGANAANMWTISPEVPACQLIVVWPAEATDLVLPAAVWVWLPFWSNRSVIPPVVVLKDVFFSMPTRSTTQALSVCVVIFVEMVELFAELVATASGACWATFSSEIAPPGQGR